MWIVSDTLTGTTTNSYADALNWRCQEVAERTILLKNTHGSNGLCYKLLGYANEGGFAKELVAETLLAAGEIFEAHAEKQWHKLVVQVKAAVGGNQATYQVDYQGRGEV